MALAEESFRESLRLDTQNANAFYQLGVIAEKSAQWDVSRSYFDQALDANPQQKKADQHVLVYREGAMGGDGTAGGGCGCN